MTVIISQNGSKGIVKESVGFKDENKLEEYIVLNPECIPVREIGRKGKIAILARQFIVDSNRFDILATDENGEIYIIETKLYKNDDKRKVASQVLDYGTALWNKYRHHEDFEIFKSAVEKSSGNLSEYVRNNFDIDDPEETVTKLRDNLSDGNFTFFVVMDEINDDLKNQIQFLNMKTDNTFAIYAVKMEQYLHDGYTIMVPKLFGFEAKEATSKYDISRSSGPRRQLDEAVFFEEAKRILNVEQFQALQKLYNFSKKTADRIEWGSSSFKVYFEKISPTRSFYFVGIDGRFIFNSHMLHEIPESLRYCDRFKENLSKIREITIPDSYPEISPRFAIEEWSPVVDDLIATVSDAIQ